MTPKTAGNSDVLNLFVEIVSLISFKSRQFARVISTVVLCKEIPFMAQ